MTFSMARPLDSKSFVVDSKKRRHWVSSGNDPASLSELGDVVEAAICPHDCEVPAKLLSIYFSRAALQLMLLFASFLIVISDIVDGQTLVCYKCLVTVVRRSASSLLQW